MSQGSCHVSHTRQWSREVATALLSRWDGHHVTQRRPSPLSEATRGAASRRDNSPPVCVTGWPIAGWPRAC
ncbi:hypothetical protein GW17_00061941 [Ensete ventricosum]|nr:hypothetical protein GW17_00061941 [Ensete ventricosum]